MSDLRTINNFAKEINACNVFNALSIALDIVEGKESSHSKKVAYIALRLGAYLNLTEKEMSNLYYGAIMHDIGISGARIDSYKEKNLRLSHCEKGESIMERMPVNHEVCTAIKYHHENWDGTGPYALSGNAIPLLSQIIHLADWFEINFDKKMFYDSSRAQFKNTLLQIKGTEFSNEIVDAFNSMTEEEKFWLDCQSDNFDIVFSRILPESKLILDLENIENIAEVFATIVDNHSNFTHMHSRGLANKIKTVISFLKYDEIIMRKAYIAGLLHDIGKLAVPESIINKPGPLTHEERCIINTHTYYTKLILESIPGIEDICAWASKHHERMDGKGYPERIKGLNLNKIERLMCVCDIYQALTEDRPYRKGMSDSKAWDIVNQMVEEGALCEEAATDVKRALSKEHTQIRQSV